MADDAPLIGWSVVANIADLPVLDPVSGVQHRGTHLFSPGTKVTMGDAYWGMGAERLHVVGLRRTSRKLVNCIIATAALENLRLQSIYSEKTWQVLTGSGAFLFPAKSDATAYLERLQAAWRRENTR